jgi:septum formation topological specificity factor MinE
MSGELKIQEKLPALAFNFEELKAWATDLAARYSDQVVTEDAVVEVKKDMAELNKARKAVDDARKEAVRRVSEPIKAFETQIKEVCSIFDAAYSRLGEQVKVFEDAQREEKRNKVLDLIGQCFADAFGAHGGWPDLEIPVQEKWLNKTTTLKSVREDIAAIIERHMEEEQRKKALEQARQDRAAAVEAHVRALNDKHGQNIPVSRFIVGMASISSTPLEQVFADIDAAYAEVIENRNRAQQTNVAAPDTVCLSSAQAHQSQQPSAPVSGGTDSPALAHKTRTMSVVIEYDAAKEPQVKACIESLRSLCINLAVRTRNQ